MLPPWRLLRTVDSRPEPASSLWDLSFHENHLSGCIPDVIGVAAHVLWLELQDSGLHGSMPSSFGQLQHLERWFFYKNQLSGNIPDAVPHMSGLLAVKGAFNQLSGSLIGPAASTLAGRAEAMEIRACVFVELGMLRTLDLQQNKLAGPLPDSICCLLQLSYLQLHHNQLAGALPGSIGATSPLEDIWLNGNAHTGSLPESLALLNDLRSLKADNNMFQGPLPECSSFGEISLEDNFLSGALPDALSSMLELKKLEVASNRLTGTVPKAIDEPPLRQLNIAYNDLAGSLPRNPSWAWIFGSAFLANDNHFTGELPRSLLESSPAFSVSNNMLEGTLPSDAAVYTNLFVASMSGHISTSQSSSALSGRLPQGLARASELAIFVAQQQMFEGEIPPFISSLNILTLQANIFTVMPELNFFKGKSIILLRMNRLSCRLPTCNVRNNGDVNVSLAAVGNHWRHPKDFPEWISPYEQDGLLWTDANEGVKLMMRIMASVAVFACSVALTQRWCRSRILASVAEWCMKPTSRGDLPLLSCRILSVMAQQSLSGIVALTIFMDWDWYKCPRTLLLLSACLHTGVLAKCAVIVRWWRLHMEIILCRTSPMSSHTHGAEQTRSRSRALGWLVGLILVFVLSLPGLLDTAGKCVPGFLGLSGLWLKALSACVGAFQALMSSLVFPHLASCVAENKHSFLSVSSLLGIVLLPAFLTIYLDPSCFGRWTLWWDACSGKQRQVFQQILDCRFHKSLDGSWESDVCYRTSEQFYLKVMLINDVCSPVGRTSASTCIMATLVRLQDVWLGKYMASGLLMTAAELGSQRWRKDAHVVFSKYILLLELAALSTGLLPILVPMLFMTAATEMVITSLSRDKDVLRGAPDLGIAQVSLLLAEVASVVVHLAYLGWMWLPMLIVVGFTTCAAHLQQCTPSSRDSL